MNALLTATNMTLTLAVLALVILAHLVLRITTTFKEISAAPARECSQAHERFQRDLDSLARKAANNTDESFPTVVLGEIDKHINHMNQMRDRHTQEATDKLSGKQTAEDPR